MLVIDILQSATLSGVALALADLFGHHPAYINKQLRKAIDILSTKPISVQGHIEITYIEPEDDPAYHSVTYVDGSGERWCAAIMPWGEWLLQPVCVHGPAMSNDDMAACLLYEMTPAGDPRGTT